MIRFASEKTQGHRLTCNNQISLKQKKQAGSQTKNGQNRKIDLNELSKQSDKAVAKQLKDDLDNLTWMIQRKDFLKNDADTDEALLMVSFACSIVFTEKLILFIQILF